MESERKFGLVLEDDVECQSVDGRRRGGYMSVEIKVPEMGESVFEATISNWMKAEGDRVSAGEPIVELETDKVNLEVSAPKAGILEKIERQVGDNVVVGEVLATITPATGDEEPAKPETETPTKVEGTEELAKPETEAPTKTEGTEEPAVNKMEDKPLALKATPLAERIAQERSVDLSKVKPTGSGGRVTKEDVQAFLNGSPEEPEKIAEPVPQPSPQKQAAQETPSAGEREVRKRMSRRRQTIARRLVEAQQTAAMLTTFNEIDMSRVMELRKRRRESFKERFGVDLGFMGFFIKAVIGALKAFPAVNAEIQGDEIVFKHYYDIGIAVGAEEGLVVPVVRAADQMSFAQLEESIRGFVKKVRDGSLSIEDLRGGTFTITNGGVFGSLLSTPILNPPQVAILGMHAIQDRPIAVDGQVVIRPMMYVALSYDHRIVDGREAVQFLVKIKELVEDPEALLFE
jgi:2-oxoglutarate dehydrogenase E2 component (dihydrolipoamide succinyltransferase)